MADHKHSEEEEYKEETLATPGVLEKYQTAGKIADSVLKKVIAKCVANASIVEICQYGNGLIAKETGEVYTKKNLEKGIAFPVCISVNEICGHFSPLAAESTLLKEGDVVKIDLGVHIDGFIAQVAHTLVVGGKASDKKANVVLAAYNSLQAAIRLVKTGFSNDNVTEVISKVCAAYGMNPLEGVLSHELKKHLIDANNVIINKENFEQSVETHEFGINEVYAVDVFVSTGEGKPKESEYRATVFKRAIEMNYILKTKSGRTFFNEVVSKYPSLCFSLNSFEDEIVSKLGSKECLEHNLLVAYPVLTEKQGELVAHFKATVCILKGGTAVLCGLPLESEGLTTDVKIENEEINTLLSTSMNLADQKKAKKDARKANKAAEK